jgi:hypothetical protein
MQISSRRLLRHRTYNPELIRVAPVLIAPHARSTSAETTRGSRSSGRSRFALLTHRSSAPITSWCLHAMSVPVETSGSPPQQLPFVAQPRRVRDRDRPARAGALSWHARRSATSILIDLANVAV